MSEPLTKWPNVVNEYEKYGNKIGRVWKARVRDTGMEVLVRCVPFDQSASSERVMETVQSLRNAGNHPKILRCYTAFWDKNSQSLYVIHEPTYCESYYVETLLPQFVFDEKLIAAILKQLLEVLIHLHKARKVWYDCRASHIYLKHDGSIAVNTYSLRSILQLKTRDSLPFMSPEIILQKDLPEETRFKADIWSFGITAVQMANREAPYKGWSIQEMTEAIAKSRLPSVNDNFSSLFKSMLHLCLLDDPLKRPSALELMNHEFFLNAPGKEYIKEKFFPTPQPSPNEIASEWEPDYQLPSTAASSLTETLRTNDILTPHPNQTKSHPVTQVNPLSGKQSQTHTTPTTTTTTTVPPIIATTTKPNGDSLMETITTSTTVTTTRSTTKSASSAVKPNVVTVPHTTVAGHPLTNVPIETYLGETETKFVVFVRAIPSTRVQLTLDTQGLLIQGQLPPLIMADKGGSEHIRMVENLNTFFERRVRFPSEISFDKENIKTSLNKSTSTLRLEIPKYVNMYLGTETF